jgi:hypothetical protein
MNATQLIYTGPDHKQNWFYKKYYEKYNGGNQRYYTFQLALNLLIQTHEEPVIIETGCQRQEEDVGAGMSTSIFAEYIARYGGKLVTCDNSEMHLRKAETFISKWQHIEVDMVLSDSVTFLKQYNGPCDLLYLDSLDYPIGENAGDVQMRDDAQNHILEEFKAAEVWLSDTAILLLDDNALPEGGKPKLLKQYLMHRGWVCLLDFQQTLWVKNG